MNKKDKSISRRSLIRSSITAGIGVLAYSGAQAMSCGLATPEQTEGPFYPEGSQADEDNNLLKVKGRQKHAKGEPIVIKGSVEDNQCRAVEGAIVEIWQACHSGRYNHPQDPNTQAELDPDFQYWGQAITDKDGLYSFKTILPGRYPATSDWIRPAHVHFKVMKRGFHELTSQIYFKGDPYNKTDRILQALSPSEQAKLILDLNEVEVDWSDSHSPVRMRAGTFDIQIKEA